MTEARSLDKLRVVGRLEEHATARHSLGYYNNVGVSVYYSYFTPMGVEQLQSVIYQAIKGVIALHPSLNVTVVNEEKPSPHFARLPSIDLNQVIRFVAREGVFGSVEGSQMLDQILEDEHNQNFRPTSTDTPLWRLNVIYEPGNASEFIASFVYHHAIADGTSGLAFHRSLLLKLRQGADPSLPSPAPKDRPSEAPLDQIVVPPKNLKLIPNLEALHPLPLSISFLVKSLWREYVAGHPCQLWTAGPITKGPRRNRFRSITFPQDTTSALVKACRSHSTSVTAALEAMLAAALFAELADGSYSLLRVSGAVSLRRWIPGGMVDDESMGTWVSRYLEEHRRPSVESGSKDQAQAYFAWDEARRVKRTIDTEVGNQGKNSVVGLLRFAGNLHKFFDEKIGKPREESFEFSNIGVFSPPGPANTDTDKWKPGRVVFSQSADVVGAVFETSLVTGADGNLSVGFSWLEGGVDGQWLARVVSTYRRLIEDVASAS